MDLSVSAGSYASQWSTDKTPIAAGHAYALTMTAQGTGGTLSLHLRDQWDIGVAFEATGSTETYSARFTAANDVSDLQDICMYLDHASSDAQWTVYSLRLEDLTASNGAAVGSVEHAGLTFTAAKGDTRPNESDQSILDIKPITKNEFFWTQKHPLQGGHRYRMAFRIRLVSGTPSAGGFDVALWGLSGGGLWIGWRTALTDLTSEWEDVEVTGIVPQNGGADACIVLSEYEGAKPDDVSVQISRMQIDDLTPLGTDLKD